ncbi:hypothetical protein A9Q99_14785 [Gammaproteobacteria bacterium 45_16_T64]|nr:hypothetical protein A9Q99_14785 [Gammaproteobacteria bacterium 45_16_T64]
MTDNDNNAFEYVVGTLLSDERKAVEQSLKHDEALEADVHFWEQQLQPLHSTANTRQPKPSTWSAIQAATAPRSTTPHSTTTTTKPRWLTWLPWGLSAALSFAFLLMLNIGQFSTADKHGLPIDYVAILSDDTGSAKLTAVTEGETQHMWLRWQDIELEQDQDLQIWALSKTDNEIRSVAVIDDPEVDHIQLSDAHWRLIKDAVSLILTAEEEGGSALDEPSDIIVAQGICVRLSQKDKTT